MKKGLSLLLLLALVAAIPACRQRDCNDRSRCNPCNWFRCKPKCEEERECKPKKEKKRKDCKKKCNPCDMFKCKKKKRCDRDEMMEEEEMPMSRREMSPRSMK